MIDADLLSGVGHLDSSSCKSGLDHKSDQALEKISLNLL